MRTWRQWLLLGAPRPWRAPGNSYCLAPPWSTPENCFFGEISDHNEGDAIIVWAIPPGSFTVFFTDYEHIGGLALTTEPETSIEQACGIETVAATCGAKFSVPAF
jgi:hypothetical protein